ncbi:MAG: hypothetical protein J6A15_09790 [Clostridia bacterium]|nr:hypothetical protein [Clostridia bacterium]
MKKVLYVFMIITTILFCACSNIIEAIVVIPRVAIAAPDVKTVEVGGTVRYTVNIRNSATNVTLKASDVRINGGTANISIEGSGTEQRVIVLSNIQGSVGSNVYISYIAPGVATNEAGGSKAFEGTSSSFTIVATVNNDPGPEQSGDNGSSILPPHLANGEYNNNNSTPEQPQEEEKKDEIAPTMEVGEYNKESIELGNSISFEITYKDDTEIGEITLEEKDITLYGFKADIKISGEGNTRKVTLSNVQGHLGGLKYVKIAGNTAKDKAGNSVKDGVKTKMFKVIDNDTKDKPDDWIENPNTGR